MSNLPYEVPVEMRDFAEKSVEQARKAFESFMGAAQKAVDSSAFPMAQGAKDVSNKAMGFAQANMQAAFDHAQKLVHAKDVQEVMKLQADYLKSQVTTLQDQAKEMGSAVQASLSTKSY
ncbi:MAG: phasin [Hyphomicrobiales bacterium]|nr:phasin [Hyphomicrobiales bacterium]